MNNFWNTTEIFNDSGTVHHSDTNIAVVFELRLSILSFCLLLNKHHNNVFFTDFGFPHFIRIKGEASRPVSGDSPRSATRS